MYPNENRKEGVATYQLRHSGATLTLSLQLGSFLDQCMEPDSYSPVLQKARQFALDGDYVSALSYYEETKSLMEKDKRHLTTSSTKRVEMAIPVESRCMMLYRPNYLR